MNLKAGFIVTIYDEDGLRLAATVPLSTSAEAFAQTRRSSITKSRDRDIKTPNPVRQHLRGGLRPYIVRIHKKTSKLLEGTKAI